jgi:Zn-dependent protease
MNYLFTHWLISLAGTIFLGIAAMVLHEFGHLVTSLMVGVKVKSVGMCMKGMYVVREAGPPAKNLLVSLAGPLTNVVLLLLFWRTSQTFALANMCLAICNLVPIRGSDGDRAWTCYEQMQKESSSVPELK